jgi:hypothetical protein
MDWRIEVGHLNGARAVCWKLVAINGFRTMYPEKERAKADRAATTLQELFGDKLLFRVVHRKPNRGAFYPAPRRARQ